MKEEKNGENAVIKGRRRNKKETRENFQSSASGTATPTKDYTQRRCVPTNGRGSFRRHESYITAQSRHRRISNR